MNLLEKPQEENRPRMANELTMTSLPTVQEIHVYMTLATSEYMLFAVELTTKLVHAATRNGKNQCQQPVRQIQGRLSMLRAQPSGSPCAD